MAGFKDFFSSFKKGGFKRDQCFDSSSENSYYDFDEDSVNNEVSEKYYKLDPKKELKLLRKENEMLRKSRFDLFLDLVRTRRSIRKFSDRDFDYESLFNIIESSLNSPAAGNIQNYFVIYVKDKKKREKIASMCLDQFWIAEAPVLLVVIRDPDLVKNLYPLDGEKYSIQNVAAFIENLLLLIHGKGLASCWIGAFESGLIKDFLSIPENLEVDAILPVGFPLESSEVSKLSVEEVLFFDKFKKRTKK